MDVDGKRVPGTALSAFCMKINSVVSGSCGFSSAVVRTDSRVVGLWDGNNIAGFYITMVYYCHQLDVPHRVQSIPRSGSSGQYIS